jgi:hypothetical protein
MAKIKNCPTPVKRPKGGTPCEPCTITEDFCYRLATDASSVVRPGKHTYDRDENCKITNEKWLADDGSEIDRCTVALTVVMCGGDVVTPPGKITLEGTDCAGEALPAEGTEGQIMQVIQPPGQVFNMRFCDDQASRDWELVKRCDPVTGAEILFQWDVRTNPPTLVSATNLATGAPYTGDGTELENCGGPTLESDPVEMCDGGVEFIRWVVKKNGVPTGVKYDTLKDSTPYVVTDEAAVYVGKCIPPCEPSISSAPADTLAGLLPGTSVSIQKSNCCKLRVNTSAGSFIVSKDVTTYSTGDFKCPVTVTGVEIMSGTCVLADVLVTTQFSG